MLTAYYIFSNLDIVVKKDLKTDMSKIKTALTQDKAFL